ncbi:hypothetical protein D3C84_753650 [compost metagenome]
MIEVAGLLVVDVGQERQVRLRVHRRRVCLGLATTPWVGQQTGRGQRFDHFPTQGLELRVGDEERLGCFQLDAGGVVVGGAQLTEQITQLVQGLLRLVGQTERAVQRHAGTDALLAGGGELQALLVQLCDPGQTDTTFGGSLLQGLLPVMVQVAAQWMVGPQLVHPVRHLVGLDTVAIALLALFEELPLWLGDVGAKAHHFALDLHVETVAVGQRLRGHHLQVTLAHLLHHAHWQAGESR